MISHLYPSPSLSAAALFSKRRPQAQGSYSVCPLLQQRPRPPPTALHLAVHIAGPQGRPVYGGTAAASAAASAPASNHRCARIWILTRFAASLTKFA